MREPKPIVTSIYDKQLEVHYNEWYVRNKEKKLVKLNLQGKIMCPLLNIQISSICCSKIMDHKGWPRNIDENICKKCDCFVNLSIRKFQERKKQGGPCPKSQKKESMKTQR